MLEVSFNELSSGIGAASKSHASAVYKDLMFLADNIMALKIAPVRIRSYVDLANTSISKDYYSLKDWLRTVSTEERQRYLGYIAQDPIVVDSPAYYFKDNEAKGFGYAFNNDLCSISYSTNGIWVDDSYLIERISEHNYSSDVEIDQVTVRHCLLRDSDQDGENIQYINHEKHLRDSYQIKQIRAIKSLVNLDDFWDKRNLIFPYLDFSPAIINQIKSYSSVEDASIQKAISYLARLNKHLQDVNQGNATFDSLPGDVSNDSEATLQMYGEERQLPTHDGTILQYSLHAKLGGNLRIYMMPRPADLRITIGYIGSHMRTKNFKK